MFPIFAVDFIRRDRPSFAALCELIANCYFHALKVCYSTGIVKRIVEISSKICASP